MSIGYDTRHDSSRMLELTLPLHLVLLVALQRHAREEARDPLFLLDPVAHQLRHVLGHAVALRDQLHLHALVLAVRLKHKCRAQVELGRDPHLAVCVERELDPEDRLDRVAELLTLSGVHLWEHDPVSL